MTLYMFEICNVKHGEVQHGFKKKKKDIKWALKHQTEEKILEDLGFKIHV